MRKAIHMRRRSTIGEAKFYR